MYTHCFVQITIPCAILMQHAEIQQKQLTSTYTTTCNTNEYAQVHITIYQHRCRFIMQFLLSLVFTFSSQVHITIYQHRRSFIMQFLLWVLRSISQNVNIIKMQLDNADPLPGVCCQFRLFFLLRFFFLGMTKCCCFFLLGSKSAKPKLSRRW